MLQWPLCAQGLQATAPRKMYNYATVATCFGHASMQPVKIHALRNISLSREEPIGGRLSRGRLSEGVTTCPSQGTLSLKLTTMLYSLG